jgi:hypothetical protein
MTERRDRKRRFCEESAEKASLARFAHSFFQVKGHGEEAEVHLDFFKEFVPEPFVGHIEFHLPEHGLRLYGSFLAVPDSLLRKKEFTRLLFVCGKAVVDFHNAIVFRLCALTPRGHP